MNRCTEARFQKRERRVTGEEMGRVTLEIMGVGVD